ncbi:phosphotransferase [Georgenia daeguensis]|uniref:phosphotransferase n=1 Tax=Georgenia daeguensis TaxID=908355 RepID=UPI0031EF2823
MTTADEAVPDATASSGRDVAGLADDVADAGGEMLAGGVANAGAVVRIGDEVRRPATERSELVFALLRHVRANGFLGVPEPLGFDEAGRERLRFIPGDVAVPPFPSWSLDDGLLASTARLLREFHEAVRDFVPPPGAQWNSELAHPGGGPIVGHNDVCVENVVVRDGRAVALIDFEFAAPTRPLHDLAVLARHWVPVETDQDARVYGRSGFDVPSRLRLVAESYGLPRGSQREELLDHVVAGAHRGGTFVLARIARGEQAFIDMWERSGGQERVDRRRKWIDSVRTELLAALDAPAG